MSFQLLLNAQSSLFNINAIVRSAKIFHTHCLNKYLCASLQTCNSTMMTLIFFKFHSLPHGMDECSHKLQTKQ